MSNKFTPGPWRSAKCPNPDFRRVVNSTGKMTIVSVSVPDSVPLSALDGNANLIAAAPELLAALQECLAWFDLDPHRKHPIIAQDTEVGFRMIQSARKAIAKAQQLDSNDESHKNADRLTSS